MRSKQIAERIADEEAHMLDFQRFNQVWDEKMKSYELNSEGLIKCSLSCLFSINSYKYLSLLI